MTLPASLPVIVSVATPLLAATVLRPVTVPAPAVCAKLMLSPASGPLVIVLPAASSIVAVNVRVVADARFAVEPDSTIWVAVPNVTVNACVLELVAVPLTVALACQRDAAGELAGDRVGRDPVVGRDGAQAGDRAGAGGLREADVVAGVGAAGDVLPAASSIVAVNVRVVADARFAVEPDSTIWVAVPNVTVNACVLELVAVPLTVALAASVTLPASLPVIVSVAIPLLAATVLRPVTDRRRRSARS